MKILIENPTNPILEGIAQTIVNLNIPIVIWDKRSPLNDMLDTYQPDILFISNVHNTTQTKTKIVQLNFSSNNLSEIDTNLINVDNVDNVDKPSIPYNFKLAANFTYHNISANSNYLTDIFYYSQTSTLTILQHLIEIEKHYQIKIVGPAKLPLYSYLGVSSVADMLTFAKSCKIALAFDMNTLYTYLVNKIRCVTICKNDIYPYVEQSQQLISNIHSLLHDKTAQEENDKRIQQAYNSIISDHTYFHRLKDIFHLLGYEQQSQECMTVLNKALEKADVSND